MNRLPPVAAPDCLYIIDVSSYVFRAYHASVPLSAPNGEPTHATFGTINMINRLIDDRKPAMIAVAMDSKTPSFRKQIDDNYKANRPPPPEDLSIQMQRVGELVQLLGIEVWQQDGVEADDLIASGVRKAVTQNLKVVIVSADKDLMQLVGPNVCMWDSMRNKVYGSEGVYEKFGVRPDQMLDYLALVGDSSDNIRGVPSVGPKTAVKLLHDYGTVQGIYEHIDDIRGKLKTNLVQHRQTLDLALSLVALKDDLDVSLDRKRLDYTQNCDEQGLRWAYQRLGFSRLLQRLGEQLTLSVRDDAAAEKSKDVLNIDNSDASQAREVAVDDASSQTGAVRYEAVLDPDMFRQVVARCLKAPVVAIDTETDGLDPMTARLVGISLSCEAHRAWYIPLLHLYLGAPRQIPLDFVREILAPLLSSTTPRIIGHNLKFDETVLRQHGFAPIAAILSDTMLESYLLDPEASHGLKSLVKQHLGITMTTYEQVTQGDGKLPSKAGKRGAPAITFDTVSIDDATPYACADADCCLQLHEVQRQQLEAMEMKSLLLQVEVPLSQVLTHMEMTGVLVDTEQLERLGGSMRQRISELEALAIEQAGKQFNVHSPRQLETILFDELKLPVKKRTAKARSTDASVLEALQDAHPLVATILALRQVAKLHSTYVDALPKLVNPHTGRIHTRFNQTVAATGRLSSSDPNLQNIPVRTPEGRDIRKAFIAPEGYVLISADYSQIELRVLAHLSQDPVLLRAFQTNEDIHTRTAMEVFSVKADEITKEQRRQAKTINFGVIYGIGDVALSKRLGIERAQARSFIDRYFERYKGVRQFLDNTLQQARAEKSVRTLLGRQRQLPDISSANGMLRSQAERIAGNTPIQGTAADLLKLAMIKLHEPVVPGARMILTVHDELVFEVPEKDVETAKDKIRDGMETVMALSVPLVVDVGVGKNWADAH